MVFSCSLWHPQQHFHRLILCPSHPIALKIIIAKGISINPQHIQANTSILFSYCMQILNSIGHSFQYPTRNVKPKIRIHTDFPSLPKLKSHFLTPKYINTPELSFTSLVLNGICIVKLIYIISHFHPHSALFLIKSSFLYPF